MSRERFSYRQSLTHMEDSPHPHLHQPVPDLTGSASGADSDSGSVDSDPAPRCVRAHDTTWNAACHFPSNRVSHTRYSALTFLPLSLYLQCRQPMNQYFLLIAILQLWPHITPVNPITTWVPLIVIFALSCAKEGVDDYRRYQSDCVANRRRVSRLEADGRVCAVASEAVQCGDVLLIATGEDIAADCVLLQTLPHVRDPAITTVATGSGSGNVSGTDVDGHGDGAWVTSASLDADMNCFIETSNIDGETNLKPRRALSVTQSMSAAQLGSLRCSVWCSPPNRDIHSFDAALALDNRSHPLSVDQFLYQSTRLQGARAYGLVVYTGNETKVGMNKETPRHKATRLDRAIDRTIVALFAFQLTIIVLWGVVGLVMLYRARSNGVFYLHLTRFSWFEPILVPLRFLLLASMMIPISLKVTLDFVKLAYALFIRWDLLLYDAETNQPAIARNSSIVEDLGQIECLLTDKTGTLTENVMKMRAIATHTQVVDITDTEPSQEQWKHTDSDGSMASLLRLMAMCNTVTVTVSINDSSTRFYSSSSPDELCLVEFAARRSAVLTARSKRSLQACIFGRVDSLDILAVCEFSSARKRQCIIIRDTDGLIRLLLKGADDVVLPRCSDTASNGLPRFRELLDAFASRGLRTLCFAARTLSEEEFAVWQTEHAKAQLAVSRRPELLASAYERIEQELQMVGVTGIEDKLATGVTETLQVLREAGVQTWMLTGDKQQTAVEIGKNCGLIAKNDSVEILSSSFSSDSKHSESSHPISIPTATVAVTVSQRLESLEGRSAISPFSLVIDGATLQCLDGPALAAFVSASARSASVVCCRVTPGQKALIAKLLHERGRTTLAIGDGGNDVAMIQTSSVGCGITGREGMQAARAADFAFARFAHLQRLLLVHGRYAYVRTSWIALYCFYKSMIIALIQLAFAFASQFSGASFFDSNSVTSYNLLYTSVLGVFFLFERDLSSQTLLARPSLYSTTRSGHNYNARTVALWMARAVGQATIIAGITFGTPLGARWGDDSFQLATALIAYSAVVMVQCLTLYLEQRAITAPTHCIVAFTVALFFAVNFAIARSPHAEAFTVFRELVNDPVYWAQLSVQLVACLMPVLAIHAWRQNYQPTRVDEAIEQETKSDQGPAIRRLSVSLPRVRSPLFGRSHLAYGSIEADEHSVPSTSTNRASRSHSHKPLFAQLDDDGDGWMDAEELGLGPDTDADVEEFKLDGHDEDEDETSQR